MFVCSSLSSLLDFCTPSLPLFSSLHFWSKSVSHHPLQHRCLLLLNKNIFLGDHCCRFLWYRLLYYSYFVFLERQPRILHLISFLSKTALWFHVKRVLLAAVNWLTGIASSKQQQQWCYAHEQELDAERGRASWETSCERSPTRYSRLRTGKSRVERNFSSRGTAALDTKNGEL